jgi:hypothetical protein
MINLAPVLFENIIWLSPSWILPSAAKAFPASVTKKIVMSRKMRRWQSLSHLPSNHSSSICRYQCKGETFSLFALSELDCTKNIFYPILLLPLLSHPKLIPFWSVPDGQTNFNTPCSLSSFFFPLSTRGPTRRRNSTGLAELWGGWPIELDSSVRSHK